MGVFSKFVIVSGCFLLFVILPSQYYLLVNVRRNSCPPEGDRTSIFLGMRNAQNKQVDVEAYLVPEKAGTPDESTIFIVPRHKQPVFVPYVKVTNRNKFEALFRDHGSSNPLPDGLTDQDYLLKYDKRYVCYLIDIPIPDKAQLCGLSNLTFMKFCRLKI